VGDNIPDPYDKFQQAQEDFHREEERFNSWPPDQAVGQASVLVIVLTALWSLTILGRSSTVIVLLNWLYAFIIDDFFIAVGYRWHRKVVPPRLYGLKIVGGVFATIVLFMTAVFQEFDRWVGWVALTVVLVLLVGIPLARGFRDALRSLAPGLETFGMLPDDLDEPVPAPTPPPVGPGTDTAAPAAQLRDALGLLANMAC
jgi:hypothetical protein